MNYAQKILAIFLGILLLFGAFHFLFYRPKSEELSRLQAEDKSFQNKLEEINQKKARLPQVRREIEVVEEKIRHLAIQYPRTIDPVYREIARVAQDTGLRILKKDTEGKPARDSAMNIEEHDLKIEARCSARVLGEFLDGISNLPVILSVSGLEISRDDSVPPGAKAPDLQVRMRITAYLSTS